MPRGCAGLGVQVGGAAGRDATAGRGSVAAGADRPAAGAGGPLLQEPSGPPARREPDHPPGPGGANGGGAADPVGRVDNN